MTAFKFNRTHTVLQWSIYPLYILFNSIFMTIGDYVCHVQHNVLKYMNPERYSLFTGQPTAEVFTNFFFLIGVVSVITGWLMFGNKKSTAPSLTMNIISVSIFATLYYLSGVLKDYPMTIYSIAMIVWVVQLRIFGSFLPNLAIYSVLLGIWGPLWEGWSSEGGFFIYYDQDAYFVPLWLSALYLNGAIAIATTIAILERWRIDGFPFLSNINPRK